MGSSMSRLLGEIFRCQNMGAVRYADGQVHTNSLENFWSLLKRGINGTYYWPPT